MLHEPFFLLQTNLEEISQLSEMVWKRGKTFIQLNWPQNEKGYLKFWYLKFVPIDSALNYASGKLT